MPNTLELQTLFASRITQIEQLEKLSEKKYAKLRAAAHTDELAKCLDPVSTDIIAHCKRIKLIKKLIPKTDLSINQLPFPTFQPRRTASPEQDILIIEYALNIQSQKLAIYELLHPIAKALNLASAAELIAQTIEDDRNTNTWLRQIIQNTIVPELLPET
ncbi:MAG: DUF892 family protein [Pedobacter sp.]|nr:DUF892 family protein [Pedobacter sp.]